MRSLRDPRRPLPGRLLPKLVAHAHPPSVAQGPAQHRVGEIGKVEDGAEQLGRVGRTAGRLGEGKGRGGSE
eukprot:scaffold6272_cov59-Isochrysis_galbana.AAC.1